MLGVLNASPKVWEVSKMLYLFLDRYSFLAKQGENEFHLLYLGLRLCLIIKPINGTAVL